MVYDSNKTIEETKARHKNKMTSYRVAQTLLYLATVQKYVQGVYKGNEAWWSIYEESWDKDKTRWC